MKLVKNEISQTKNEISQKIALAFTFQFFIDDLLLILTMWNFICVFNKWSIQTVFVFCDFNRNEI